VRRIEQRWKFFGDTPSDITVMAGEHVVKITISGQGMVADRSNLHG
jgi:hypothetical protein